MAIGLRKAEKPAGRRERAGLSWNGRKAAGTGRSAVSSRSAKRQADTQYKKKGTKTEWLFLTVCTNIYYRGNRIGVNAYRIIRYKY